MPTEMVCYVWTVIVNLCGVVVAKIVEYPTHVNRFIEKFHP